MPKKTSNPEMRAHYDLSKGARNKYAKRMPRDIVYVALEPDVSAHFSDAKSVNKALRGVIAAMDAARPKRDRSAA
jgi:hypothetical protein